MIPYDSEIAENNRFPVGEEPEYITYEQFVTNLVKERGDREKNLEHMVIGICGEAGEIADGIKKNSIYGKPLDRQNIVEELGDLEFYMAGLRQMLNISRFETLAGNVSKLQARYKGGYSDAAAIERADKAEPSLHVIDVTSPEYIAKNPPISKEQVAAVDEQVDNLADVRGDLPQEWQDQLPPGAVRSYHSYKGWTTFLMEGSKVFKLETGAHQG